MSSYRNFNQYFKRKNLCSQLPKFSSTSNTIFVPPVDIIYYQNFSNMSKYPGIPLKAFINPQYVPNNSRNDLIGYNKNCKKCK